MVTDLDIRLIRHFVAVAEDLHFTRAAARVYVTQQTLSRDVRKLETSLGMRLLDRDTRQVTLTADGARLLPLARALLSHHDEVLRELAGTSRAFVVDVVGEGTTPTRILAAARHHETTFEYYSTTSADHLDATFGEWPTDPTPKLRHRLVRREPVALMVPATHPLTAEPHLRTADLRHLTICCRAGTHATPAWERWARSLLSTWDADPADDHPYVRRVDELAHHLRDDEPPVLTLVDHPTIPGTVVLPITDAPAYPWTLTWPVHNTNHPGLVGLHRAIDHLTTEHRWT